MDSLGSGESQQRVQAAASLLRNVCDSRRDRAICQMRQDCDDALRGFMASLPSLDHEVHDWQVRLTSIANARAASVDPDPTAAGRIRTRRGAPPVLDMNVCVKVISNMGCTVHAVTQHQPHGDVSLVCTDGRRRLAFDVRIMFGGAAVARWLRVGACVGVVVFLDEPRLFTLNAPLVRAFKKRDITTGRALNVSCTRKVASAVCLMRDLIRSDATEWMRFCETRYACLEALPKTLIAHGWGVLPSDNCSYARWSWRNGPRDELDTKSFAIVRDRGATLLWIVWIDGRLVITTSERGIDHCEDTPLFFGVARAQCLDDAIDARIVSDGVNVADKSATVDDWRLVQDLADRDILFDAERAWMVQRGFISAAVIARDESQGDTQKRILGCNGDPLETLAMRAKQYASHAKGEYGPTDASTGQRLNGLWCRRRFKEACWARADRIYDQEGPIDPYGPVTTNWTLSCSLAAAFGSALPSIWLPDIVAYAHIVGENDGTSSASFVVVVTRDHTYGSESDDAAQQEDVDWLHSCSKLAKAREAIGEALMQSLALLHAATASSDDHQVHPLVERNIKTLRASPSTHAVLCERRCAGQGVDIPRAVEWAFAQTRAALALFEQAAAGLPDT